MAVQRQIDSTVSRQSNLFPASTWPERVLHTHDAYLHILTIFMSHFYDVSRHSFYFLLSFLFRQSLFVRIAQNAERTFRAAHRPQNKQTCIGSAGRPKGCCSNFTTCILCYLFFFVFYFFCISFAIFRYLKKSLPKFLCTQPFAVNLLSINIPAWFEEMHNSHFVTDQFTSLQFSN